MSEQNNGGPAFPLSCKWDEPQFNGMTLRDYFAAKAMAALIVRENWEAPDEFYATWAYEMADEMLKARG